MAKGPAAIRVAGAEEGHAEFFSIGHLLYGCGHLYGWVRVWLWALFLGRGHFCRAGALSKLGRSRFSEQGFRLASKY